MKLIAIIAILFAVYTVEAAIRRPIPYNVYVALGGLPLPLHLRQGQKWYVPEEYNATERIVGGTVAAAGSGPWTVAMLRSGSLMCGGSIFNARTVITAAHCTSGQSASTISVRYNSLNYGSGGATISATRLVTHSGYNSGTIDNDVALIILTSAMTLGQTQAKAVSLPSQGSDPSSGTNVVCHGWGTTSEGGSISSAQREVTVPIVARATCNSQYGGGITNNMVCAGVSGGGKDACQGDSGGPLTANGQLLGIVSWGYGCARPNYPGVYTRTGNYNTWITSNAQN